MELHKTTTPCEVKGRYSRHLGLLAIVLILVVARLALVAQARTVRVWRWGVRREDVSDCKSLATMWQTRPWKIDARISVTFSL